MTSYTLCPTGYIIHNILFLMNSARCVKKTAYKVKKTSYRGQAVVKASKPQTITLHTKNSKCVVTRCLNRILCGDVSQ